MRGRFGARVLTPLGDSVLVDVFGPGQSFGELALLLPDARRSATVEALEAGETRSVFRDDFSLLQREHPGVKDVLLRLLAEQLRRSTDRVVEAHHVDAETRVRRRLLELAATYEDGVVPLTQEDIAAMAGTSRATVNRVLREEQKLGAVALARGQDAGARRGRPRATLPPLVGRDTSLAREVVQQRAEQAVEALRARDAHPLAGRVRADDLRPDRDHLDAGQLLAENGALETAVDDRERRLRSEQPGVRRLRRRQERRVEVGLPRWIGTPDLDLGSAEPGEGVHRGEDAVERGGVRASRHRPEHEGSVLRRGGRQARARLDDTGQAGRHRQDAGRDCLHEIDRSA